MAWIPIHDTLFDHPKLLRAADALGIAPVVLAGHLAALWSWVRKYGQGGMLSGDEVSAREIARGARWPRKGYAIIPGENDEPLRNSTITSDENFVDVLVANHWLRHVENDEGQHAIQVPHWENYAGKYEQACIENAAKLKAWRASQGTAKMKPLRNGYVTTPRKTTKPLRDGLEEKRGEKSKKKPTPLPPKGEWPGFDEFWAAYPTRCPRRDKALARKAWDKALPPLPQVLAALAWQDKSEEWIKDGGSFIPGPAVWLNQRRWEREQPANPDVLPPPPKLSPLLPPGWEEGDHVRYRDRYPPDSPQWKASDAETRRRIQERWRVRGEGFARA